MKCYLFIIAGLFTTFTSYTQSAAKVQEPCLTIQWNGDPVSKVENDIQRLIGYSFWDYTKANILVKLKAVNMPLHKVLDAIFPPPLYKWEINDKIIAIKQVTLKGLIVNKANEPVEATVSIKGTKYSTTTDEGKFSLPFIKKEFTLLISAVNYDSRKIPINGDTIIKIIMEPKISTLTQVAVLSTSKKSSPSRTVPSPKDTIPLPVNDTKTGSVLNIGSDKISWVPTANLTDKLSIVTGALGFNANIPFGVNQSPITIRNRITIFGNPHILFVVDGIPYAGDINQINPNDIESITILKDAAASTQMGLRAGNGVILITSKSGSYNSRLTTTANANITVGMEPNPYYLPYLSAPHHIELTRFLFENGYYDNVLNNTPYAIIPPAINILRRNKLGLMNNADAEKALTELENTDNRKDVRKYLYKPSIRHQYHIAVQGGRSNDHYYYSMGYDINKANLVGNSSTRFTNTLNNSFKLGKKGPEINTKIYLSESTIHNDGIDISNLIYPYEKLVDNNGNSLAVTKSLNQAYKDSISTALPLLDWNYRPVDEISTGKNKTTNTAIHISLGMNYHIFKNLEVSAAYRNETETSQNKNQHAEQSYFTRDFINQFTQIDSTGRITYPVPLGTIVDRNTYKRNANNLIAQLKYTPVNTSTNVLTFSAGSETRHLRSSINIERDYGVTQNGPTPVINYNTNFSTPYVPGITNRILQINDRIDTIEHFYGIFANGVYTWKNKLNASLSYRKDESNIFGVRANLKEVPLFAAGISWDVNRERFYHSKESTLRLRLSTGYCSNASQSLSSLTGLQNMGINSWNAPINMIVNPPNPWLSLEKVSITNIGVDFSLFNNKVWGTTEYFTKQANNLLGMGPFDPTSGISVFQGNVAAMSGCGLEVALNTKIGNKDFSWQGTTLMSYVKDKVTNHSIIRPAIWYYCDPRYINPVPGKPLFAIYSFAFGGLDSLGDPVGIHNNNPTKKYDEILQSPNLTELVYHGSATPTFYGSFRNIFTWKQLELGFNIVWKAGYYFRAPSINYTAVMNGESIGHPDFEKRWKVPGDEHITNIPSLRYPFDYSRDQFYTNSSALVQRGDHIRLQDIRLTYRLHKKQTSKSWRPISEVYGYANNLGLIWKANDKGIDPDFLNSIPMPVNITIGIKTTF